MRLSLFGFAGKQRSGAFNTMDETSILFRVVYLKEPSQLAFLGYVEEDAI
jgi:hypothetical protein